MIFIASCKSELLFCGSESILNLIETKEDYVIKVAVSYYFEIIFLVIVGT